MTDAEHALHEAAADIPQRFASGLDTAGKLSDGRSQNDYRNSPQALEKFKPKPGEKPEPKPISKPIDVIKP